MGQCVGKPVSKPYNSTHYKTSKKESKRTRKNPKKSKRYEAEADRESSRSSSPVEVQNYRAPLSPSRFKPSPPSAGLNDVFHRSAGYEQTGTSPPICVADTALPANSHNTSDTTHNTSCANSLRSPNSDAQSADDTGYHSHDVPNERILSPADRRAPTSPLRRMFHSPKIGGPRVLFKSPLGPKTLALRREKNNSTSSLFIKDSISAPDTDEIIRCMAVALLYHIKNGMRAEEVILDSIFSEQLHPLTRETLDLEYLPDINTIYRFLNMIFKVQRLPAECAILCICYLEKALLSGRIVMHSTNWRRLLFSSIMLATKVWEDESVWNVDFLDVFPLLTILDLNKMENRFLEFLQFNVITTGSEYAKYYFELRALSQGERFPLEPLNRESQAKLELRSQKTNAKVSHNAPRLSVIPKRCRSVDKYDPKSPPVTLH